MILNGSGKLTKLEVTALEDSWLSFEGGLTGYLLQNVDEILQTRGGGLGLQLYTRLYDDPHVQAVLNKLADSIISRDWIVSPGGDKRVDIKAADMVREQLADLNTQDLFPTEENHGSVNGFDSVTRAMIISGRLNGYCCSEVMWAVRGDMTVASEIRVRDPRQFGFMRGQYGYKLRHLPRNNSATGVDVEPKKILVFSYGALDGNPYGRALGRAIFWSVFFKKQITRFDLKFLENFASPKVVGKYPRGSQGEQVATLTNAINAIANETGIAIPETMLLEYLQASTSGTVDAYERSMRYWDEQISEAVLTETGSTNQSGGGGSRARDEVGERGALQTSKAIADALSSTFSRLARWIVSFNLPEAKPPTIYRNFEEGKAVDSQVQVDKTLFDLGYRLTPERVADTYGENYAQAGTDDTKPALISSLGVAGVQALTGLLTQAATGQLPKENAIAVLVSVFGIDEVAAGKMVPDVPPEKPAQANPLDQLFGGQDGGNTNGNASGSTDGGNNPVGAGAAFSEDEGDSAVFAEPNKDSADRIAEKARPLIEDAIAPWLTTITNFVEQASTLEEIRDGLVDLYPEMDGAAFAEAMGHAISLADLAGREEVLQDDADVAFGEMLEAALATGTIEFAASSGNKPNCNPAKSHFCQKPNGRGSCVSLSKKCKFKPSGAVQVAGNYTGQKVQPISPKTASEQLKDAIAAQDFDSALDLSNQIYLKVQADVALGSNDFYPGIGAGNSSSEDHLLKHLYSELGYDAKPEVLKKKDIDNYLANGETAAYRAIGSTQARFKKHFDNFKTGDYFAGHGVYGHGTYVAAAQSSSDRDRVSASASASGYGSGLMRMTLKQGSTVVSAQKAETDTDNFERAIAQHARNKRKTITGQDLQDFNDKYRRAKAVIFGDNGPPSGRFGVLSGWDAISLKGTAYNDDYMVLLNRGAVRIQGTKHQKYAP
jgi:phage gp29-like protein